MPYLLRGEFPIEELKAVCVLLPISRRLKRALVVRHAFMLLLFFPKYTASLGRAEGFHNISKSDLDAGFKL